VPDDPLDEIRELRENLSFLSRRLEMLEKQVASRAGTPAPEPRRESSEPAVAHEAAVTPAPASPARENLELRIGRYWLNRIGILSLVLGTAFFLVYSFQYLGPVAKLAMGYAVGAVLLITGLRLERKPGIEWYARGLLGGGWAVLYFTTYAMHHVPETKILDSAGVDLLLLLVVAAGAVRHSLVYRSQTIVMLAFLLGFLTTGISEVNTFTFASAVILIGSIVMIAVRMRWHGLLLYGAVGSYLTHLVAVQGHLVVDSSAMWLAGGPTQARFWLHASFLALYWVGYTIGVLALDEREEPRRNVLATTTLVNGLAFSLGVAPFAERAYPGSDYVALLVIGTLFLAASAVASRRSLRSVSTTHLLLGLSTVSLAIPAKLTHRWTSFFWLGEVASLAWLGVRFNRWAYRIFALVLGVVTFLWIYTVDLVNLDRLEVFGQTWSWRWVIGCAAILCYAAAAAVTLRPKPDRVRWYLETQSFHLYSAAACLVLWILTSITGHVQTRPLYWSLEAATITLLGWALRDRGMRLYGTAMFLPAVFGVTAFLWFGPPSLWSLTAAIVVAATLYAMSLLYRASPPPTSFGYEPRLTGTYAVAGTFLLAAILWHDVPRNWLSLAWALEGLALVVIGFRLPDKFYRMSGLGVFLILLLKILFVDLAAAETIYRILSFAVAGAILLLASFGYAKFTGKESKPEA
jgi:uncharacterized membrane protein